MDAAFGSDSPSQAFATIEEKLGRLPPEERADLRALAVEALGAAFVGGKPLTEDWLRSICAASPNYLRASHAAAPRGGPSLEERLCALLIAAFDSMAPAERGALFEAVMPTLSDISLPCALFRKLGGDWTAEGDHPISQDGYFGERAEALRSLLLDRAIHLARSKRIWTQASAAAILWFWFACGQEQEAYVFVKQSMREPDSLAAVLELSLEPNDEGRDAVAVRRWSKIIDFNTLEIRAVELLSSAASNADRTRARRFLDAYANGKSELFR